MKHLPTETLKSRITAIEMFIRACFENKFEVELDCDIGVMMDHLKEMCMELHFRSLSEELA